MKRKLFGYAAVALVVASLFGVFASMSGGLREVVAQVTTGWNTRHYNQPPADALASVSAGEVLGYGFKFNGATWDRVRTPSIRKSVSLTAGTTETTIWTPTSGKKFRVLGLVLTATAATTLTFKDNTAGSTLFTLRVGTDAPIVLGPEFFGNGYLSAAADNVLTITRGTSSALEGVIVGQEQ